MQNSSFSILDFALRRTACSLALAALCALPVAAHAAEPAWWTAQKKTCGLPPGLAYNSWDGVCRKSPDTGGGSAQDRLLLEGAGALGTAIGESIHESLFGNPEEEARKTGFMHGSLRSVVSGSKAAGQASNPECGYQSHSGSSGN